jgi:hypothetical protein
VNPHGSLVVLNWVINVFCTFSMLSTEMQREWGVGIQEIKVAKEISQLFYFIFINSLRGE